MNKNKNKANVTSSNATASDNVKSDMVTESSSTDAKDKTNDAYNADTEELDDVNTLKLKHCLVTKTHGIRNPFMKWCFKCSKCEAAFYNSM